MKKLVTMVLCLAVFFSMCGCDTSMPEMESSKDAEDAAVPKIVENITSIPKEPEYQNHPEPKGYDFDAQYIRTDALEEGGDYPRSTLIYTRCDLDDYVNKNKDTFDMQAFEIAIDKYDESWFDDLHMLFIVVVDEASCSVSHEVTFLTSDSLTINRTIPEAISEEPAQWHILIEPHDGWNIADDFRFDYTENLQGNRFCRVPQSEFSPEDQNSVEQFMLQIDANCGYEMTLYENDTASKSQVLTAEQVGRLIELLNGRILISLSPASEPMQVAKITCPEQPGFRLRIELDCGNLTWTDGIIGGCCELSAEDIALLQKALFQ